MSQIAVFPSHVTPVPVRPRKWIAGTLLCFFWALPASPHGAPTPMRRSRLHCLSWVLRAWLCNQAAIWRSVMWELDLHQFGYLQLWRGARKMDAFNVTQRSDRRLLSHFQSEALALGLCCGQSVVSCGQGTWVDATSHLRSFRNSL